MMLALISGVFARIAVAVKDAWLSNFPIVVKTIGEFEELALEDGVTVYGVVDKTDMPNISELPVATTWSLPISIVLSFRGKDGRWREYKEFHGMSDDNAAHPQAYEILDGLLSHMQSLGIKTNRLAPEAYSPA